MSMLRRFLPFSLVCLVGLLRVFAQNGPEQLAPGTLLVASAKLGDPNFSETVVFIIRRDREEGTMGVVLNRRLDVTLAKAFPQMHATGDPVYEGGPVSPDAVQALLRTTEKADNAERIVGDIYHVTRKASLEKSIADHVSGAKFRVYLGYAGWGPGQLESEMRQGAWTATRGAKYVFDSDPATLWERLNRDSQSQVAKNEGGWVGQSIAAVLLYTHTLR